MAEATRVQAHIRSTGFRRAAAWVLVLIGAGSLAGGAIRIDPARLQRTPDATDAAVLTSWAQHEGWAGVLAGLEPLVLDLHERQAPSAADWWARWKLVQWLATDELTALRELRDALPRFQAPYRLTLTGETTGRVRRLAELVQPELIQWLLAHPQAGRVLVNQVHPVDHRPRVLEVLDTVFRAHRGDVDEYWGLLLAVALVHDMPEPPPHWPHAQVDPSVLPRRLAPAADVFAYFVRSQRARRLWVDVRRLEVEELRFVVAGAAPLSDWAWVLEAVPGRPADLASFYQSVTYDQRRAESGVYLWPGPDYRLATVRARGGICVDQAFFASEVGRARGVPTLLFAGTGRDGRHAWIGYFDGAGPGWRLDVGRGPDQRLVSGWGLDPQTWLTLTDHEVRFLSERFRSTPRWSLSVFHGQVAAWHLERGDTIRAEAAAQLALGQERRNLGAWETLIALEQRRAGTGPGRVAAVLGDAARTFQRYPDIETHFGLQLIDWWRRTGQAGAAEAEQQRLLRKFQNERPDLSAQLARRLLDREAASGDGPRLARVYERILLLLGGGPGAGLPLFDEVVSPYVRGRLEAGDAAAARRGLVLARRHLETPAQTQMAREFAELEAQTERAAGAGQR